MAAVQGREGVGEVLGLGVPRGGGFWFHGDRAEVPVMERICVVEGTVLVPRSNS